MHTRTAGTCVIQLCTPGEVWHLKTPDSSSQLLSLSCPLRRCDIEQTLRTLIAPPQSEPLATLAAHDIARPQPLGLRILVAEDNSVNQVLIRQILTQLGCQVDLSRNGQEALDLFKKHRYDVILMDCQMPIMDGFQATQKIRAHELAAAPLQPRTPIVALTAMTLETDVQLCLDVGMDDYLSKPLDKTLLEKKLRHWRSATNECMP